MTGASRGIGEAIARRFAAEGARVALAARDEGACERIAAEIRRRGGEAIAVGCDVTLPVSVSGAIASIAARWGRIDILVNNAGLGGPTPLDDADDSRWNAILATNLTATFRVTREAAPFIPKGGRVMNLSSVLGRFGVPGYSAYCASKHGVIGLTRALALELAPAAHHRQRHLPGLGRDGDGPRRLPPDRPRAGGRRGGGPQRRGEDGAARPACSTPKRSRAWRRTSPPRRPADPHRTGDRHRRRPGDAVAG